MKFTPQKLGFVGSGAMPRMMAARLRNASYSVIAFDPAQTHSHMNGSKSMPSAKALAQEVDVVLIYLPDDVLLERSMMGEGGALKGSPPQQLLINFGTISPAASRRLAAVAIRRQLRYVEAPMLGGMPEAEGGSLVFLAGGSHADFEAAKPILQAVGRKTIHIGTIGQGLIATLIMNGVLGLVTAALAETLAYGVRSGIDRDTLIDALSDPVLMSEHHRHKLAIVKAGDYSPQLPVKLMSEDLGLLLEDARTCGAPMPSMAAASQLFSYASQTHPDDDYAAVVEAMNGLP